MPARNSPPLGKRQIFKAELWDLDFVNIIFLMSFRTIRTIRTKAVSSSQIWSTAISIYAAV
jgi:hypothetical protein